MKQILPTLGRFLTISLASFGIATFANWVNHRGYWNGTIYRVQTTDFNMLVHMLPTKLSYALIERDSEELQRTLDSNYGLFGMVVTNCTTLEQNCQNQQILYSSTSKREWRQQLNVEMLVDAPYSILRNPPPLLTTTEMKGAHEETWAFTGKGNSGEIIGRVYYVRGIPPSFWVDYQRWLLGLPSSLVTDSGAQKYYSLTLSLFTLGGLGTFGLIEWLLYRKRLQKHQSDQEKRQLLVESERLRQELQDRLHQQSILIAQREQFAAELATYQTGQDQHTQQLERMISHLENQLALQRQSSQQEQPNRAEALEKKLLDLQAENQRHEQTLAILRQRITQAQNQTESIEAVEALKQELASVVQWNQAVQQESRHHEQLVSNLRVEILENEREQREMKKLIDFWHQQAEDSKQREIDAQRKRQEVEKIVADLNQEKEHDAKNLRLLENRISELSDNMDDSTLNRFERSILGQFQGSPKYRLGQWPIGEQFDVTQQRNVHQVTDFVIIGQSCVFVIEAKAYSGEIRAQGDARNTPWICQTLTDECIQINSSGGRNPYEQIIGYTNGMMGRVRQERAGGKVGVYGLIVFPENADVSRINTEIGGYYRITTLERLIQVIQDLEASFILRSQQQLSNLSPKQLEDLICRRLFIQPVRKSA